MEFCIDEVKTTTSEMKDLAEIDFEFNRDMSNDSLVFSMHQAD